LSPEASQIRDSNNARCGRRRAIETNTHMSQSVKAYICWVSAAGSVALAAALSEWRFSHPVRFPIYFALAVLTAMVKIRFPRIGGTFASNSLFVILGLAELDITETMLIACGAAAGQTLLNVKEKPNPIQLIFNIAAAAVSTSVAALVKKTIEGAGGSPVWSVALAAAVFYLVNTLVVSGVLALLHAQSAQRLWRAWMRWTTPAFIVSAAAAMALFVINPTFHPGLTLLFVPVAIAFQLWYRRLIDARVRL